MDDQNKNLLLATVLSFVVIVIWFVLFPPPEPVSDPNAPVATSSQETGTGTTGGTTGGTAASGSTAMSPAADASGGATPATPAGSELAAEAPRLAIDTPRVAGSISLRGGRLDDLKLKDYRTTLAPDAPDVTVLRPVGQDNAYYTLFGWIAGTNASAEDVPGPDTDWTADAGQILTPETPVTMEWRSPGGLIYRRTVSIDENYMFTVAQTVENTTQAAVALRPYGLIRRHGEPSDLKNFFVLHEGMVRMSDGELQEEKYKKMAEFDTDTREGVPADRVEVAKAGWIGFTDHYWMTTLIPNQDDGFRSTAKYFPGPDIYQTEAVMPMQEIAPGETISVSTRVFSGAKEWDTIRHYQNDEGVDRFIDAIDWGWFFFLTKPIFFVLHWLHSFIGNMGWSIIALTFLLKLLLFPLAYKSYASMAKMKELQPEMEKLKERAGDDRQKLQKEMMELYRKEKVNPAAGCLPILLQIPIFFSLYKVIFVTIELRQQPWFGPFRDLSAPDPTSIMNFFGLLPWAGPEPGTLMATILIGILPLCLGVSMWLQQKLNPAPADPTQQMIFAWMPWVFMFMLGSFASGLVIYWISNNVITFTQQYLIMRSQGYTPDVFGNIKSGFKKTPKSDEGK